MRIAFPTDSAFDYAGKAAGIQKLSGITALLETILFAPRHLHLNLFKHVGLYNRFMIVNDIL